ncbi:MAG: hypothetical protein J6D26_06010 [Clostridia bacterium]|nr:hypothetical protein [Clostridia bacterium]
MDKLRRVLSLVMCFTLIFTLTSVTYADEYIINDDFNSCDAWSDAVNNGWKFNKANIGISGESDNKYVSFSEGEIHKEFTLTEGIYEISYSIKPGAAKPLVLLYSSAKTFHILSQCSEAGAVNTAAWGSNVVANVDTNTWISVKHMVDLDSNTATCEVYDAGGNPISTSTTAFSLMNGLSDIAKLTIQNQKNKELLVDNVIVKPYSEDASDPEHPVDDTFDDISSFDELSTWKKTVTSSQAVVTPYDDGTEGNYITVNKGNYTRNLSSITQGKYKITYKLKPGTSQPIVYLAGSNTGNMLLTEVYNGKLVTNSWAAANMIDICTLDDTASWITIEAIVDVSDTSLKINAYDESGELIGTHERTHLTGVDVTTELTNFDTFHIDNWNDNALSFDDISIKAWVEKPSLLPGNVTIINYKDEKTSLSKVSPATKTITLDFNTPITEDSEALITISPDAEYTGEVVGDTYVMTFTKALIENTSYTINAPADIANKIGDIMGEDVNIEFNTTGTVNEICIASVEDESGSRITTPGDILNKTIRINTHAANCSDTAKNLEYIVALYNGDKFIKAYVADGDYILPAEAVATDPVSISVGSHENVTTACVFLWDSLESMISYCEHIELRNK